MEKEKFFLIGRPAQGYAFQVISALTEDYDEVRGWYDKYTEHNALYTDIKIAKTIYG